MTAILRAVPRDGNVTSPPSGPVPRRPGCALCRAPAASALGLCLACLAAAADELARLAPRPAPPSGGPPSSVPFSALCRRCGSWRHPTARCDA
jgi:hypothetical protein